MRPLKESGSERLPREEGLSALDRDLAGSMASEGGRSAQITEAAHTQVPRAGARPILAYGARLALVALGGALLAISLRHRSGRDRR